MARFIAQRDLRNQNAQILNDVEAGATFVITRNGAPVAELRPLPRGRCRLVPKADIVAVATRGPRLDAEAFREDLDAVIDQGLDGA